MRSRVWQTRCMPRPNGFDYIDFGVVPLLHSASIVSPPCPRRILAHLVLGASTCAHGFMCGYLGSGNLDCNVDVGFLQHNIFDGTFTPCLATSTSTQRDIFDGTFTPCLATSTSTQRATTLREHFSWEGGVRVY
jgi:hypothetical protein